MSVDFAIRLPGGPSTNYLRVSDVSVENANSIHDQEKFGNERDLHTSSHPRSIAKSLTSSGSPSCSSGEFAQDTPQVGSSKKSRRWSTRTKCIRFMSRSASCFCRCSVTLTGPTSTMKSNAGTKFIARIRFCRTRCWTLLGPADEEEWYGTLSCQPEGNRSNTAQIVTE